LQGFRCGATNGGKAIFLQAKLLRLPFKQRFLNSELAARRLDHFLRGSTFEEFKTVTKCISLPRHSQNFYLAKRKRAFQPNHLSQRYLVDQHRRNSRLADVHRVSPDYLPTPYININRHIQFVTGMSPALDKTCVCLAESLLDSKLGTFPIFLVSAHDESSPKDLVFHLIGNLRQDL
jgi:hypothetical protein